MATSIRTAATRFVRPASVPHRRAFQLGSVAAVRGKHTLPDLPYDYNALEPAISAKIMELHHSKHHQTYVNGLNAAEEQLDAAIAANDVKKQIELQAALRFNGGGHLNHTLFWEGLKPEKSGGGDISKGGELAEAIKSRYGDLEGLKKELNAAALGIQGSGWAWLGLDPKTKSLAITTCPNQDPLTSLIPLIGIDMWEHAYYSQHDNRKPDYLNNIWRVINFENANQRYEAAKK